ADGAPLQHDDRQIVGGAVAVVLVERGVRPGLLHVEVLAREVPALLDDDDARPRLGQHGGGDAAAGAAADHAVVALDGQIGDVADVADPPWAGDGEPGVGHDGTWGTTGGPA